MLRSLGIPGIAGVVMILAGIGLIGYVDPLVAAGLLAILVGLLLVVKDLIGGMLAAFGLQGLP